MNPVETEDLLETTLAIAGHQIHVRLDRRSSARPLLLLNGLTRPLERWDPLVGALSSRTIIRFDPPGIGASPAPLLPLSIPTLAEIAGGVLDLAEAPVADVLGYSHGGAVAQQLCHTAPERVGALVLASTTCGIGSAMGGIEMLATMFRQERPGEGSSTPTEPMAILYRSLALACWTSIPFLGSISAPTLVLSGDRDRLVPPVNSRILANRIRTAELTTLAAGHDLQHPRCTPELAALVGDFLDAHA